MGKSVWKFPLLFRPFKQREIATASTPRIPTKKPGAYYRIQKDGRKQFYIRYRDVHHKAIEECFGASPRLKAAKATVERSNRISGVNSSNSESRKAVELERSAIK